LAQIFVAFPERLVALLQIEVTLRRVSQGADFLLKPELSARVEASQTF
jgi:hypothetical protein